jgi:pimeloyl-ACP methyl ester carboxylesterase
MKALLSLTVLLLSAGPLPAAVRIATVRPAETDPAITRPNQPHRVFLDRAAAARGELLVYLPGTAAQTTDQDHFGRLAATLGYHVVYIMYPNDTAAAVCNGDEDETTFEKFRREIISGEDLDPRVQVGRPDSIEHRLLALVRWLAAQKPDEGWGQFLDGSAGLVWRKVALAGHSQGGGHAQLMAKDHAVARVIALGSPKDFNHRHGRPAAWYGGGATPPSRIFALIHEQDTQACTYVQQLENLRASGLGSVAGIDGAAPPYGGAHVLVTHAPGGKVESAMAHLSLVFDFTLPRAGGRNLLAAAWEYLLTAPAG